MPLAQYAFERGTRALGRRFVRRADMHEADHAFVCGEAEQRRCFAIVGGPAGQPLRAEAERLRAEQQVVGDAARRKELLLRGNLRMIGLDARDDRDDQRREA